MCPQLAALGRVEAALKEGAEDGHYSTVVIDPLTVFWQLLQDAGQALSPREWGIIKRRHASVLTRLVNLPLHVVLVARDTDLYEGSGSQLKKVGVKADVEKSVPYVADFVLACGIAPTPDGPDRFFAVVEKSRSPRLPKGRVLDGYRATPAQSLYPVHLAALAAGQSTGERVELDEALVAAANGSALADEPGARPEAAETAGVTTLDGLHSQIRMLMGPSGLNWTCAQASAWLQKQYRVEHVADLAAGQAEAALSLLRKLRTRNVSQDTSAA